MSGPGARARIPRRAALVLSLAAVVLAAAGAASAAAPTVTGLTERQICNRLRAHVGPVRLPAQRRRLTILATGDSMIYPADEELGRRPPRGVKVIDSRHDGTGLTTTTVNWKRLSEHQASTLRPDLVVISLGGRDGGISLPNPQHGLTPCCGTEWLALYGGLLRPLIHAYLRGGRGRVYWLLLPAPRELARQPLFEAVNAAISEVAAQFPGQVRLIPVNSVISPGGFQEEITYDGLEIHPRAPDGIHLDHAGACVERSLVMEALLEEGVLVR